VIDQETLYARLAHALKIADYLEVEQDIAGAQAEQGVKGAEKRAERVTAQRERLHAYIEGLTDQLDAEPPTPTEKSLLVGHTRTVNGKPGETEYWDGSVWVRDMRIGN